MPTRDQQKQRYHDFRAAAKRLAVGAGVVVPDYATVQMCEGGAFVEATIWVGENELNERGPRDA